MPSQLPSRPRFVTFANRSFSDADIDQLLARPAMIGLTLTDCRIGEAQLRSLCTLPRLERLWLEGCAVSDTLLPAMAAMPRLNWLNLDRTGIDGSGLPAFAGNTGVTNLSLRQTRVDDGALAFIRAMEGLSYLGLEGSRVSDAGVLGLAAMPLLHLGCADERFTALQRPFIGEQRRLADRTDPRFVPDPGDHAALHDTVLGFFQAMSDWEHSLAQRATPPETASDWKEQECRAIFDRFCTPKDRKYGRPTALSFQTPPQYCDHAIILTEWLTPKKACVYTLDSRASQSRFVLVKKKEGWRLDHRQQLFDGWQNTYF